MNKQVLKNEAGLWWDAYLWVLQSTVQIWRHGKSARWLSLWSLCRRRNKQMPPSLQTSIKLWEFDTSMLYVKPVQQLGSCNSSKCFKRLNFAKCHEPNGNLNNNCSNYCQKCRLWTPKVLMLEECSQCGWSRNWSDEKMCSTFQGSISGCLRHDNNCTWSVSSVQKQQT